VCRDEPRSLGRTLCYGMCRETPVHTMKRLAILTLGMLLAISCSGRPSDTGQGRGNSTDYSSTGISVHEPVGWFISGFSRTVIPPRLVVASYPVTRSQVEGDCGGLRALAALPPRGIAVLLIDYGPTATFPPPPKHFSLQPKKYRNYECVGRSYRFRFQAAGHNLQAHIAVGRLAAPARISQALAILDSLAQASK
jgi:hypothetical protein